MPDSPPSSAPGVIGHFTGLLAAIVQSFSAHLRLLGIESKEAARQYAVAGALAAGALFVVVLGYLFLIVSVVFAIAAAFDNPHAWIWIMAAAALLHLLGAAGLLWSAYTRARPPVFTATIAELHKDSQWLRQP